MSPPTTHDIITSLFQSLSLPSPPPYRVLSPSHPIPLPSSYNLPLFITTTTLLSTLTPALLIAHRNNLPSPPGTTVSVLHAAAQYVAERLYTINSIPPAPSGATPIGGLHPTRGGGHVRIHDGFPHHQSGAFRLLGLSDSASREDVTNACLKWPSATALEAAAHKAGLPIYALRTAEEWSLHPQSSHTQSIPILLTKLSSSEPVPLPPTSAPHRCLSSIRILELSRVIAAPSAGKLLSSHGADILWITSASLPNQPTLDVEFSRGKRSIRLDLTSPDDKETLLSLVKSCDVFLQSYRPGSLAAKGFSAEELLKINPNIIYATLSAFGPDGPWANNRGFDSLVQACTGMNYAEAQSVPRGQKPPALPLPCQALDYGAGHLLASGICAALYHRATSGGAYKVEVSLAGAQRFLEGMGRVEDGFACEAISGPESFPDEIFEERDLEDGMGTMRFVKAAGAVDGVEIGWERMPGKLGRDEPQWLPVHHQS